MLNDEFRDIPADAGVARFFLDGVVVVDLLGVFMVGTFVLSLVWMKMLDKKFCSGKHRQLDGVLDYG